MASMASRRLHMDSDSGKELSVSNSLNPYESPRTITGGPDSTEKRFRFYWGLGSIPELAALPKSERRRLWRRYCWGAFRHWQTWLAMVLFAGFAAIFNFLSVTMVLHGIFPTPIAGAIAGGLAGGLGGLIYSQVQVSMARPYLHEALAKMESSDNSATANHQSTNSGTTRSGSTPASYPRARNSATALRPRGPKSRVQSLTYMPTNLSALALSRSRPYCNA
jgi:hypothetical protein